MFPATTRGGSARPVRLQLRAAFRPGRWILFLLGVPLGVILSIALQTHPVPAAQRETTIRAVSAETILRLEEEQRSLKDAIKTLREQVAVAQRDETAQQTQLTGLSGDLQALKRRAGLTPMQGPGIKITLDDSQSRAVPVGTDANLLLVHDFDLRDTIALLWSSGAEAIDINGQRIVDTTSIYCVGTTILVNDTRLSPPYVIQAIGPTGMQATLSDPVSLAHFKGLVRQYGLGFKAVGADDLTVAAFDGRTNPRYAVASAR
ncbi:MAG: hypothetical protein QOF51_1455 [Chloroflexota bacterium]|jgi:uncharacterized protein YlxW (UPF0749 family)|nr:hypothetical protein [Chloroflexota bacterium]